MRIRNVIFLLFILSFAAQDIVAQKIFERKRPAIFPLSGRYKLSGFHFAPGATYILTRFSDKEEELFNSGDSIYNATFSPEGGLGMYLEGGWFKVFKYGSIIRYMDVSIAYKQLKGKESYVGELTRIGEDPPIQEFTGEGTFNEEFVTFNANVNNVLQLGDRTFLQNSLGINFDYLVSNSRSYSNEFGLNRQEFSQDPFLQIHYKLGFGWKISHKVIMIPSIETPILSVMEWDDGRSDLQYFSSRYRPLIFSVRFILLRPAGKGMDCVPVKIDKKRRKSKEYKPDSYHP